ncbi:hypothetical protein A2950_01465 [Candidatus Kaiserbacteria bacterium RIFCSPLOWO2_01_FULL_55_19]|uniref:Uncharacterized protein n=1 Tax=Candidatus Kaiserbacteria bacterium RIFCSPLOWO2_01_FULL_55_19 TaxID=1798516 RepID=A0A1F6ERL2_9BACT|nr:MAG: hypothetical protein A2950_01465 [Candidatus Kaiserbacteria bacterium RIFCSPLOWO2_01_FULL_55_19]
MTTTLAALLIVHVLGGIIAIGMHNVVLMHLLKKAPNYVFVSRLAWSAFVLFILSWATSAYYYVTYYGSAVKPRILAGSLPFAHTFFMETKEHIFLVLPFLALSIALCTTYLRMNPDDDNLRKGTAFLTLVALVVGVVTAASGIIVSGSI